MLCHFRHRFHDDPLINVGVQDIGAWVDFTAVAEAACAAGLTRRGLHDAGAFPDRQRHRAVPAPPSASDELAARVQLARQAMLLTLPGEMGERFKVIGLSRGVEQPLRGFGVRDLAATSVERRSALRAARCRAACSAIFGPSSPSRSAAIERHASLRRRARGAE